MVCHTQVVGGSNELTKVICATVNVCPQTDILGRCDITIISCTLSLVEATTSREVTHTTYSLPPISALVETTCVSLVVDTRVASHPTIHRYATLMSPNQGKTAVCGFSIFVG